MNSRNLHDINEESRIRGFEKENKILRFIIDNLQKT